MKKILTLIFVAIAIGCAVLVAQWGAFTDSDARQEPVIVAFGDSVTEGVGASFIDFTYVSRLSVAVDRPIANLGVSGDTTGSALARIDQVVELQPDIVIVFLGGNDAIRGVPVDVVEQNLVAIIDRLEEVEAEVLLLGTQEAPFGFTEFTDLYSEVVENTGVASVSNFYDGILSNSELLADPIHPNDDGYGLLAERVEPALEELLADLDAFQ